MPEGDGIVIVGGGPAARAAAGAYREAGGEEPLRILAGEPEWPYERPPLTKEFLRGRTGREEILLDHADWYRQHQIEVELGCEVAELDLEAGEARDAEGRVFGFERALLATGSRPLVPEIPGADGADVRTVRTIGDAEQLRALTEYRVLVVGSGFVGCEAAASLALNGAEVTLATMETAPQAERLGEEVAARIAAWLAETGVDLIPAAKLERIAMTDSGSLASFEDGREREAAAVVLALGVVRNDSLAAAAGLEVDNGVAVDSSMVSADPRLLAAGDVAWAENGSAGRRLRVEHWGEALAMGEVAGRTLAGEEASWDDAPGFWCEIGGHTLKYAGWGEGFDEVRFEPGAGESFVARYGRDGELVGVLAHDDDDAYEEGRERVEGRAKWS